MRVVVPWRDGLHLRPAAKLVQIAQKFRSQISLECRGRMADPRSILSIVALCATMGTPLDLQATGEDEQDAARALEEAFSSSETGVDSIGAAIGDKV
ncbi:MAG TPA: phosphocarrier protein HPr [Verrucomicrobiales bacterium]|nr:phosphocarrier protein HPr [Verrucomicrobiales bacterium]